jgi:hypothetical protein
MRHVAFAGIAIASIAIACGPDPNARLPGSSNSSTTPSGTGGSVAPPSGTGGATVTPSGTGGASSPFGDGGAGGGSKPPTGSGGSGKGGATVSAGGSSAGGAAGGAAVGAAGSGGVLGHGGSTSGAGGTSTPTSGALTSYSFPAGTEPCTPTMKDVSGGHSDQLGASAGCFRTADEISNWSCSGADDRTVKVNGAEAKCGGDLPKKAGSFYYFELSAGANNWATVSWWCSNCGGPGTHAVPSCGQYPAWKSGATGVAPCADGTSPGADAAAPASAVDSGS